MATPQTSMRLDAQVMARLDELAAQLGVSRTEVVRMAIAEMNPYRVVDLRRRVYDLRNLAVGVVRELDDLLDELGRESSPTGGSR